MCTSSFSQFKLLALKESPKADMCRIGPSSELQVQPSRVQVVKKDRRTETCERHVSQLMVRGEQVALIAILD
uniref:Uncharacterized protein n=1 Tax=Timema poppense TaxID=170557 RepID=A0A7R9HCE2_TIMPO|nr:unnamed protein product [Timema poppensis]